MCNVTTAYKSSYGLSTPEATSPRCPPRGHFKPADRSSVSRDHEKTINRVLGRTKPNLAEKSSSNSSLTPYALNLLGPNASNSVGKNSSADDSNSIDNKSGVEEVKRMLILAQVPIASRDIEGPWRMSMLWIMLVRPASAASHCKFWCIWRARWHTV